MMLPLWESGWAQILWSLDLKPHLTLVSRQVGPDGWGKTSKTRVPGKFAAYVSGRAYVASALRSSDGKEIVIWHLEALKRDEMNVAIYEVASSKWSVRTVKYGYVGLLEGKLAVVQSRSSYPVDLGPGFPKESVQPGTAFLYNWSTGRLLGSREVATPLSYPTWWRDLAGALRLRGLRAPVDQGSGFIEPRPGTFGDVPIVAPDGTALIASALQDPRYDAPSYGLWHLTRRGRSWNARFVRRAHFVGEAVFHGSVISVLVWPNPHISQRYVLDRTSGDVIAIDNATIPVMHPREFVLRRKLP